MRRILSLLFLVFVHCGSGWTYETANKDTIEQQIIGTWLSTAAENTCEWSDKRTKPPSTSRVRMTYNADGTFVGRNIVERDGKFERNLMFKGTYRIVLASFDGPEVPALFTKVEEVTNSSQSVETDERMLEMIVMTKPAGDESVLKHLIVGLWRRPGSLNPCPSGEATCSYWVREESK